MRESEASLAIIERQDDSGALETLTLWSYSWDRLSLPGGHLEAGESAYQACERELCEELHCQSTEFDLDAEPTTQLRFVEKSAAAQRRTKYIWHIFHARLSTELLLRLEQRRDLCWITYDEAMDGKTSKNIHLELRDQSVVQGRVPIGDQVSRALTTVQNKVTWMAEAAQDLGEDFRRQIDWELLRVFHEQEVQRIIVKQRFAGYVDYPERKLILAVEVQFEVGSAAHVVKLGTVDEVGGDLLAWKQCADREGIASRMFIAPKAGKISQLRQAAVYSDVYQYYFDDGQDNQPHELEFVIENCVHKQDQPTSSSVERVLAQVYTEAHRCFYRKAKEETDLGPECVRLKHIFSGLRVGGSPSGRTPVLEMWSQNDSEYLRLRLAAAWVTDRLRWSKLKTRPTYIDPIDALHWALGLDEHNEPAEEPRGLPPMLIGPSHGDLHGRNLIVGISRGEAEWPAVFDFDKMTHQNLIAWDFAKLEMELKCRIFQGLIDSPAKRQEVRQLLGLDPLKDFPDHLELSGEDHRQRLHAEMLELMFFIERRLHDWTAQITNLSRAKRLDADFSRDVPSSSGLGRAMKIILRIRREAAIFLGFERQRVELWRDEYYFALASYGVISAKWPVTTEHLMWALMTSGVASAEQSQWQWRSDPPDSTHAASQVSYHSVLLQADECWKQQRAQDAEPMLRDAIDKFSYSMALQQQLALSLISSGRQQDEVEAQRLVQPLANLACAFRDHEVLCRIGRVYKERGDGFFGLDGEYYDLEQLIDRRLPAVPYYEAAFQYYHRAFEISQHYYPAVNAATLAMMTGKTSQQRELAGVVLSTCAQFSLDQADRPWVQASQGEATLLLGQPERAKQFYSEALLQIDEADVGILQSIYNQLCRLSWALGTPTVAPVLNILAKLASFHKLAPGPFGDCGHIRGDE